ncbi:MAG: 4-hydroxy-3-methylbut-2-enyl diphosphate reductase [Calditrichia bacterium]
MKILIDEKAGFCKGVERVIKMAERRFTAKKPVYALGELIHNHEETRRLYEKGLRVVNDSVFAHPESLGNGRQLLIRAHGEPPATFENARTAGIELIDGTCPVVARSQKLAREYHEKGYQVIIVGKEHHPEVIGIAGHCEGDCAVVLRDEDLRKIDLSRRIFVLAQTTISGTIFRQIIQKMETMGLDMTVKNTICRFISGRDRQIQEFARNCDIIIMVGGKHSSNTRVLFRVCRDNNARSFWVENAGELDRDWFSNGDVVGITGSASTPRWLMEDIGQAIEKHFQPAKK